MPRPGMTRGRRYPFLSVPTAVIPSASIRTTGRFVTANASGQPPNSHSSTVRVGRCHCPGGCHQPARACEVHHVKHKAHGGPTSVKACVLLCFFHHQIVIHRWGWTLVLNPDGTTTAWNRDRTKVLHSHSPPARAG